MSGWNSRTVLVTGAGGFIGSHLTERLVALGAKTRGLIRYNAANASGWLERSPVRDDVEIVPGDVRDRDSLRQAVRGVDVIFHLAALIGIPYSYHAPVSYLRTNAEGTLNILQAALDAGVKLVVHTSTSEVYGTARYVPIDEQHPLQGQSPYSASKIAADKIVEAFHCSFGLPVVTARPFNTYGPRQSARAVIPTIITQALTGSEIRLGSLAPRRNFNYVADTVDGFIRLAECPQAVGEVVNLGSEQDLSIGELVDELLRLLGKTVPVVCEPDRQRPEPSEVERLCADNRKAKTLLGWAPRTPLREGLSATIDWVREHAETFQPGLYTI